MVTLTEKTGIPAVPATIVVNSSGEIVPKQAGYHGKEELRAEIQALAHHTRASADIH